MAGITGVPFGIVILTPVHAGASTMSLLVSFMVFLLVVDWSWVESLFNTESVEPFVDLLFVSFYGKLFFDDGVD